MKVEDFEGASKKQLVQKANEFFSKLDDAGHEQRPAILTEAQFYLQERDRRHDSWISLRDLILELVIIVLIGLELWSARTEGRILEDINKSTGATAATMSKQFEVLDRMNASTGQTVKAIANLQDAQDRSLKSLDSSLAITRRMESAISTQLTVLKSEQQARIDQQNRHPAVELRARTFEFNKGSWTVLMDPGGLAGANIPRNQDAPTHAIAMIYLRNVGNMDLVNAVVTPRVPGGIVVRCLDFITLGLYLAGEEPRDCQSQFAVIPPIVPRPKNRSTDSRESPSVDYDSAYDFGLLVQMTVPRQIHVFDLELVVKADQLEPVRYRLQCHLDLQ
ncbi:MAG TPA: hypothetical protein VOA88_01265 [Candidatus Dormibacteraeota bacterium]|nr:hypothetical protein [Candidatus Dormibacteraeota bacterium]